MKSDSFRLKFKKSLDAVPATARLLILARLARSFGQGALVVDFALYLHALHWSGVSIGALFMGGMLFGAALTSLLGPLSDRLGRRQFLIGYEFSQIAAASIALMTAQPAWLAMAAIMGGFGRGANGSPGPFAPVEQSWLANNIEPHFRGLVFSFNSAMGFFGMCIGALLAGVPGWVSGSNLAPDDFRLLFWIVLLGSVSSVILLRFTRESKPIDHPGPQEKADAASESLSEKEENSLLIRLAAVNVLSGLGVGLVGPLLTYWFKLRFGVGPGAIGPVMALAFFATGVGALLSGWMTRRFGVVNVVVYLRLFGLILLLPMAFSPSFLWAGLFYVARSALSRGTVGARQALGVSLVNEKRRGLAASINSVSMMLPFALGPFLAGALFQLGALILPFVIGTAFQAANLYLYRRFFLTHDPSREAR